MSDYIYENQSLIIVFDDTDEVDLTAYTLRVDYWVPGNITGTPSGSIAAADITCPYDGDTGQASIAVEAVEGISILTPYDELSKCRWMLVDDTTNTPWKTGSFYIRKRGS